MDEISPLSPVSVDSAIPPLDAALPPPEAALTLVRMFLDADPVVKGVMVVLFLASLVTWAIILEKALLLRRFSREIRQFNAGAAKLTARPDPSAFSGAGRRIVQAGLAESCDTAGQETRAEFRERVERAMRGTLAQTVERLGRRSLFLATVASSSPFIGLFGTVWGIMHSFAGIAVSGETSLAVVAPGISEALFATAMGLAAAIPALLGYNGISALVKRISRDGLTGIALLGNLLAHIRFTGTLTGATEPDHARR